MAKKKIPKEEGDRVVNPSDKFVDLNFKVQASYRKEFKMMAASMDVSMKELFERCFECYKKTIR